MCSLPLCSRASRLHTASLWMPWCQSVAPSDCSVHRGHFPGCFMVFSQELNLCFLASIPINIIIIIITTAVLLWQGVTLLLPKMHKKGRWWTCCGRNFLPPKKLFHCRGGLYSPGENLQQSSWACASTSWALLEGVPGSVCAINDNNTVN